MNGLEKLISVHQNLGNISCNAQMKRFLMESYIVSPDNQIIIDTHCGDIFPIIAMDNDNDLIDLSIPNVNDLNCVMNNNSNNTMSNQTILSLPNIISIPSAAIPATSHAPCIV